MASMETAVDRSSFSMKARNTIIKSVRTLFDGWNAFHRVTIAQVDTEGFETTVTHSVEAHGEGVAILPFDPERKIALLVRQVRTPVIFAYGDGMTLEAPAGGRGSEAPAEAARRELLEEVGIAPQTLELVGAGFPMPGVSTELTHLFLAAFSEIDRVSGAGGGIHTEGEVIEIVEVPLLDLEPAIKDGRIKDLKAITLLYALKDRRPELFRSNTSASSYPPLSSGSDKKTSGPIDAG
jgi:nudix-type nucleoside diphosphatase (YffH/AdpP family)